MEYLIKQGAYYGIASESIKVIDTHEPTEHMNDEVRLINSLTKAESENCRKIKRVYLFIFP